MHVPVVKQHCAQMEGFAFSHITALQGVNGDLIPEP